MTTMEDSEEFQKHINDLHRQGLSDKEMALVLACTVTKVQYHRKLLGLKRHNRKVMPEDRVLIRRMDRDGMTQQEIADHFGLAKSTINRVLRKSDTNTNSITDVLTDPVNKFLASRWTAETVRHCLV